MVTRRRVLSMMASAFVVRAGISSHSAIAQESLFPNDTELAAFAATPLPDDISLPGRLIVDRLTIEPGASLEDPGEKGQMTLLLVEEGTASLIDEIGLKSQMGEGISQVVLNGSYGVANETDTQVRVARARLMHDGEALPDTGSDLPDSGVVVSMVDIAFEQKQYEIPANTTITVINNGAAQHDFVVDELGIATKMLNPGESEAVVIDAPAGIYEAYCSVPGHKQAGMVTELIVTGPTDEPPANEPAADANTTDLPNGVAQDIIFETAVDQPAAASSLFLARVLFEEDATLNIETFGGAIGIALLRGEIVVERPDRLPSSFPNDEAIVFPPGYDATLRGVGRPRAIAFIAGIAEGSITNTGV